MKNEKDLLTGSKQTMLSWMKKVESFDDIPDVYQSTCLDLLGKEASFPYMVLSPGMSTSLDEPTESLLFLHNDLFYIIREYSGETLVTAFPQQKISYIEVGNILLYSWFSISGITSEGAETLSTIFYNAATHRLIAPFIQQIRQLPTLVDKPRLSGEEAKFDYLDALNFKFKSYACQSLRGDEEVHLSVWQPEIARGFIPFLGKVLYQTLSLAHLVTLTNKEVIIISDDKRSKKNKGKRYGGFKQYIPLQKITYISMEKQDDGLLQLSLHLSPENKLSCLFEGNKYEDVLRFREEVEKLMTADAH